MTDPRPLSMLLDLLDLVLEQVLLALADAGEEQGVEVILVQAQDLQHSLSSYWRERLGAVTDDELPF